MNAPERKRWIVVALLVGVLYFVVGFTFAAFARWSLFNLASLTWNKLAFLISAIVFVLHIGFEYFRLKNAARLITWHTSLAVALGAFGLALAANIHDLESPSGYRPRMLIALVAWPLITGVPAFFVALIAVTGLSLVLRRAR